MKNTLHSIVVGFILLFCCNNAGAQYIIHIAGSRTVLGHGGDSARALKAELRCPMSVCRGQGNRGLFIGDGGPLGYNNDACIRYISDSGIIYTIAGRPGIPDSANNTANWITATNAKLQGVAGICLDKFDNLLIADGKSMVRKIILSYDTVRLDTIMTMASGLDEPYDVAVDNANNIYICERGKHQIRLLPAGGGPMTTFAGRNAFGFFGDGGLAINAKLNDPRGIHIANNTLYIADYGNNRVRAVSLSSGIINTVAGNGIGFGGDGGPAVNAQLTQPVRVTTDLAGNLYIADVANQRIRKVEASTGNISTYAGNGAYFFGPDVVGNDGPATAASIVPYGMAFDNCGNMFVGSSMYSVRAITLTKPKKRDSMLCNAKAVGAGQVTPSFTGNELKVFPDPNNGHFTLQLATDDNMAVAIVITDITGRKVKQISATTNRDIDVQLNEPTGMYFVQAVTEEGRWSAKIVMQ